MSADPCSPLASSPCAQDEEEDPTALEDLLSRLAAGMGPGTPLRRLAVNRNGHFALPSGCLIAAGRLLQRDNVACAAAKGLAVLEWEGTGGSVYGHARVLLTPS